MFTYTYWLFCTLITSVSVLNQRVKPVIRRQRDHCCLGHLLGQREPSWEDQS